ncbi:MAG: SBBP repeat-containing protein [bacterium]|nr:SBBP repeat-containing protein [bacterium]
MKRVPNFKFIVFLFSLLCSDFANSELKQGLGFSENKGQVVNQNHLPNTEVLFLYNTPGFHLQLRKTGYSYEFFDTEGFKNVKDRSHRHGVSPTPFILTCTRVDIDFLDAQPNILVEKEGQCGFYQNYIIDGKEFNNLGTWEKVTYKNVYRHIDIEFLIGGKDRPEFKYNLILHPGAQLSDIKMLVGGAELLQNPTLGSVTFKIEDHEIYENIPFSFYADSPSENKIVNYAVRGNELSFVSKYDTSREFIIDPVSSLQWGTYFGGNSMDICTGTGVDDQNNVYTSGYALSIGNIATNGAYQTTQAGNFDAFISKFNSAGQQLWGSYFGGSSFDLAYAMHVEPNGNVYITGDTYSQAGISSPGAFQAFYGGGIDDVLLAKFNSSGQRLWSTYYGGADHDIAQAITVDKSGNVLISGHSSSPFGIATPGAYSTFYNFNYDVFVAKFSPGGGRIWGSYYGDSGMDETYGIATDTLGNIYITGGTASIASISSSGAYQVFSGGGEDAFISCFNSVGTMVTWATFFGGSGTDFGTAIEVRNSTIFVAGTTTSTNSISSAGAYQQAISSADDSFLASFTTQGARNWSTYFGGEDVDYINDLVLDSKSNILFCGSTMSSFSISTAGAYQPSIATNGNYDAYFAVFSPAGFKKSASYFGGEGNDNAHGLALDQLGKLYLTGETTSTLGISTTGAHMATAAGGTDGFLAKFCIPFQPSVFPSGSVTLCKGIMTLSATAGYPNYAWSNSSTTNPVSVNLLAPGNYTFYVTTSDAQNCVGTSDTTHITILSCLSLYENKNENSLLLFPSPAGDQISVKLKNGFANSDAHIVIRNALGCSVLTSPCSKDLTVMDLHELTPGIYILSIQENGEVTSMKFIKE